MSQVDIGELYAKKRGKRILVLAIATGILLLLLILFMGIGPVSIPPLTVVKIVISKILPFNFWPSGSWTANYEAIVLDVRLPRLLSGVVVGSALASAGCAMQGIFRNPMASPYIVGVSSGAAFGAALAIVLGLSPATLTIPAMAFLSATLAVFLVYNIARTRGRVPVETLLLSGIAVGAFFSALVSFIQYISGEKLAGIVFWLMGGLWASGWKEVIVALPLILLGTGGMMFFSRDLNIMLIGESHALDLGVEVEKVKRIVLVLASLITASAVAISGIISFVGLIIPHIMRILVGPDHRILLPASCLAGAIFLVLVDMLARTVIQPTELPVGIITALFGAPFFLYLLRRRKRLTGW